MSKESSVTAALVSAGVVLCASACSIPVPGSGCAGSADKTLASITHVDGAKPRGRPGFDDGNRSVCGARLETQSSGPEVMSHYREQLQPAGWTVKLLDADELRSLTGCDPSDGGCPTLAVLQARRLKVCLSVMSESAPPTATVVYVTTGPCDEMRAYDPQVL